MEFAVPDPAASALRPAPGPLALSASSRKAPVVRPFTALRRRAGAVGLVSALALAGCATQGPPATHTALATAEHYGARSPGTGADAAPRLALDWYRRFQDPSLDALIGQALEGTPSLQVAYARAEQAAAQAGIADAALSPHVDASATSYRVHLPRRGLPDSLAGLDQWFNGIGLSGKWELDLFGLRRAQLDAALGSARAAEADAQGARIQLSTQVAQGWYALARLLEQQRTLREIGDQRLQTVNLVRQRVASGLDTQLELRQAEAQAFEVDRDLAMLDEQIANTRHALAALAGQPPRALDTAAPRWEQTRQLDWPDDVPVDLLGRRADLTAARWRVEAAMKNVAAARAQFYPNISLNALARFGGMGFSRLIASDTFAAGIGPAISLPVFDGGRLRANLKANDAEAEAAIATYNGALLDAVRDATDRLTTLASLREQQQRQIDVQHAAEKAQELAMARYRAGLSTFLTVLQAQTNVLTQHRVTVDLKFRVVDTQIALIRALGGGYQSDDPPGPPPMSDAPATSPRTALTATASRTTP